MPPRVTASFTRDDSPPSESEKSFVSAGSENTWPRSDKEGEPHIIGQSGASAALRSSSPQRRNQKPIALANFTSSTTRLTDGVDDFTSGQTTPRSRILSPPLLPSGASYFTPQPGVSGLEPRFPQNRRPPGSRSSRGIETSSGPPPALITQRSYTGEAPWRNPPTITPRAPYPLSTDPSNTPHSIDSIVKLTQHTTNEDSDPSSSNASRAARSKSLENDGLMTTMAVQNNGHLGSEEDQDSTLRMYGKSWEEGRHTGNEGAQEQSISSNEDLFLNLAKADSVVGDSEEPSARRERRRSHIGSSSLEQRQTSRPSSSGRPSTSGASFAGQQVTPDRSRLYKSSFDAAFHRSPEKDSLPSLRDLASVNKPYAASAHPLDQRSRIHGNRTIYGTPRRDPPMQDQSPETPPLNYGRRRSIRETSPGVGLRNYRQSNLSHASNGNYGSSPFPGQSSTARGHEANGGYFQAEGTESTVSTTAPSTVWDELDDLKSRLRKLELTGALPSSSNAAMSKVQGERPPTATTTVTTISSSPKRRHMASTSPEASTVKERGVSNLHPLLHSALAKAKPALNANLYKALEATASDALALAVMTGGAGSDEASVVGPASGTDRRLRRTVDNMCRSLTELCIALAAEAPETEAASAKIRPGSRDAMLAAQRNEPSEPTLPDPRVLRGGSVEPEARTSSRVMSRLEARRTSLLGSSPSCGRKESPSEVGTPTQTATPVTSRLDRTSTVVRRNGTNDQQVDGSSDRRPPSRAATEIGWQTRPSPQTRMSREYTSQHPMPGQSQRSPSVHSSLPMRKSYFSSPSQSPITPSVQSRNRSLLERSTPPSSADSARLAEARQRRIASLGQHSSASQSRIGLSSGRLRLSQPEQ